MLLFYSGDVKYVFFLNDSLVISDTYCSDKKSILQFVSDRKGIIELIGIEKDRIVLIEALETDQNENSILRGSEYLAVYPENEKNEEIGVLIKISE